MARLQEAQFDLDLLEAVMKAVPDNNHRSAIAGLIRDARSMIDTLKLEGGG